VSQLTFKKKAYYKPQDKTDIAHNDWSKTPEEALNYIPLLLSLGQDAADRSCKSGN